jgi:hypothetical protein
MENGKDLPRTVVVTVPRFERKHILYMALCLAGAAAALWFFWRDLNLSLQRLQDEPVGTLVRKHNTAQRRFADRTLWDRLRRQSPVYPGDYVRTAALSEAEISLSGGELVELGEHTLIQIVRTAEGLTVELAEGAILADTRAGAPAAAGGGGLTVRAGGASLRAGPESLLDAAVKDGGLEAGVAAGSAVLTEDGETRTLGPGETAGLSRRVAVSSPRPGAGFLNASGGPLPVTFAWNRTGFDPGQAVYLEIAEDRAFANILLRHDSLGQRYIPKLENGLYYWRAYPGGQNSAGGGVSGRLTVVDASAPELVSPAMDEEFSFSTARPGIRFLWTSREGAESYYVEISANSGMTDPFYQSQVRDSGGELSSIVFSGLDAGTWYWRIRPEYPRAYEGTVQVSRTGSFRIRRPESLAVPLLRLPARQGNLYLEDIKEEAYFSWKQEEDAVFYTFLLSRREDLSDPFIKERVRDNYFACDLKNGKFAPGQYYWGVYQTDAGGLDSAPSAARMVVIMAGPPPEGLVSTEAARPAVVETPRPAEAGIPAADSPPAVPAPAEKVRPAAAQDEARNPVPPAAIPGAPPKAALPAEPALPPLPAPGNMRPPSGYILTEEIIVRDRQVSFSWNAVPGALSYIFILYQAENGGRREVLRRGQDETRFTLTDLAVLDAGTFIWRVEPVSRIAEQKGEAGESVFTVNIRETQASRVQESGPMFGNE